MSLPTQINTPEPIEITALAKLFDEDTFEQKVNLGFGSYRTKEGKPWVLPVVRTAEKALARDDSLNKENLPALGLESFHKAATNILLGEDNPAILQSRAFGVQCLSGTGALRVGAEFLSQILGRKHFYYSNVTWDNQKLIFKHAGFEFMREYRYWSQEKHGLDFEGIVEDLQNAPENSVIILHACAHSPPGCDPTIEQWAQIAEVMKKRKLFPFFDSAYQGFASGDLEKDAFALRFFVDQGFELFCAQSFAKNFGLYNERVGNLVVVLNKAELVPAVKSQLTLIIRGMYLNPPSHGARIVSFILSNPDLLVQWRDQVKTMFSRITEIRYLLREALEHLGTPGNWKHITDQVGMISYIALNEAQCIHMVNKYHIYMIKSGRINMCGLTPTNVDYVAHAIYKTLKTIPTL